jgi:hypothetical protein
MVLSVLNLGARKRCVLNAMRQPLYAAEEPVPIVQGVGWSPGRVRMGSRTETVYPSHGLERKTSQPVARAVPATPFRAERIILKSTLENCDTGVI